MDTKLTKGGPTFWPSRRETWIPTGALFPFAASEATRAVHNTQQMAKLLCQCEGEQTTTAKPHRGAPTVERIPDRNIFEPSGTSDRKGLDPPHNVRPLVSCPISATPSLTSWSRVTTVFLVSARPTQANGSPFPLFYQFV